MTPMYSPEWFATFAATVPVEFIEADLAGITALLPLDRYPRILDVGCGIGRIAGPLAARGYAVTGLDISVDALSLAGRRAAGPRYVALDQRHIGNLRWRFDAALVLWNSLGFVDRGADADTLAAIAQVLRPGGRVVLDLYHPEWLRRHERTGEVDDRGASVRRWVRDGRCLHEIRYPTGRVDDIRFNVYTPEELAELASDAGLTPVATMAEWRPSSPPSAALPRYQFCGERSA
jgi:SAM-dependent methyltransferase